MVLTGRVVGVTDGDTITVLAAGNVQHRIRLHGIDCPEKPQPFGTKAKQFTSEACFGKTVRVELVDTDRYGRTVGDVILPDGRNLNHEIVRAGLAWHYVKYAPGDRKLAQAESEAREARRGLWAEAEPVPPWQWRRGARTGDAGGGKASGDADAEDGGYWLNTRSNVRHSGGCKWYRNTSRGRPCGRDEGKACGICGG